MRVLRTGSTITAFVSDIMSSTLLDVDPLNPPDDAWPLTYPSEAAIEAAFPQHQFEYIGEPQKESDKVSPPVSDEELRIFLKEAPKQPELFTQRIEQNNSNTFNDLINHYKLLVIDYKHTKNKLESKLKKAYLDGYSQALILQFPYSSDTVQNIFNEPFERFSL